MANTFFNFNTTLNDHGERLGSSPEDIEGLEAEEEYDALNDETFGGLEVEGDLDDWEAQHEQLAEIAESSRHSNDIESFLDHLGLNDEEEEEEESCLPTDKNVWAYDTGLKNGESSNDMLKNSLLETIKLLPNISQNDLSTKSTLSPNLFNHHHHHQQQQQHHQQLQQQQQQQLPPPQRPRPTVGGPPKLQTVEELERMLLNQSKPVVPGVVNSHQQQQQQPSPFPPPQQQPPPPQQHPNVPPRFPPGFHPFPGAAPGPGPGPGPGPAPPMWQHQNIPPPGHSPMHMPPPGRMRLMGPPPPQPPPGRMPPPPPHMMGPGPPPGFMFGHHPHHPHHPPPPPPNSNAFPLNPHFNFPMPPRMHGDIPPQVPPPAAIRNNNQFPAGVAHNNLKNMQNHLNNNNNVGSPPTTNNNNNISSSSNNNNNNINNAQMQQSLQQQQQQQQQQTSNNRRNSTSGANESRDEYAGLMNNREKQWLLNIQLLQVNTGTPYFDDYYYTVFKERQAKNKENQPEHQQQQHQQQRANGNQRYNNNRFGGRDGNTGHHHHHHRNTMQDNNRQQDASQNPLNKKIYTPMQFENSLGKLQFGSVTAPRKIIDMDIINLEKDAENTNNSRDSRKTKQLLLELEALYTLILKAEDLKNPVAIQNTEKLIELKQKQRLREIDAAQTPEQKQEILKLLQQESVAPVENQADLLVKIIAALLQDEKMQSFLGIRKGKMLLLRILPQLPFDTYATQLLELWTKVLLSIPLVGRRDTIGDNILPRFHSHFKRFLCLLEMDQILELVLSLIEVIKLENNSRSTPLSHQSKSPLHFILQNKFGISAVSSILQRVDALFPTCTDKQTSDWANFVASLVDTLTIIGGNVAIPLDPLPEQVVARHADKLASASATASVAVAATAATTTNNISSIVTSAIDKKHLLEKTFLLDSTS